MVIKNAHLKFDGDLQKRPSTSEIVIHHTGVSVKQSVEIIHNYYLHRSDYDFVGIGYNFYVRKDGSVWQGRPIECVGGHCINHNFKSVGICFEGNFEKEKMNSVQFNSGVELIKYVLKKYPDCKIYKHKQLNATDCPGKNFPFADMVGNAQSKKTVSVKNPASKSAFKVGDRVKIIGDYASSAYSGKALYSSAKGYVRYITKIYKGAKFPYQLGASRFSLLSANTTGFAAAKGIVKV